MADKNNENTKVKEDKLRKIAEDDDASIFKRVAILVGVIAIAFIAVLVAIKLFFEIKYRFDKDDINVVSNAKEYGLMLENINILDSYTTIDSDTKNQLKKNAKKAVKNYDNTLMDSERLAGLLLADKYLELGKSEKLIKEMKKYFDSDTKLINSTRIREGETLDKDEMAANTVAIAYMLRRYDDVFAEIDIYGGLADYFNEKIELSDNANYSDYLREIFFFMYEENKQSMIKTDKLKDLLEKTMSDYKIKIDNEDMLYTINDVMMAKRLSEYRQFFYNDLGYADSAQEIFEDFNSDGAFMTDTYEGSYMYALDNALFSISDIEGSEYFTTHVGETFKEYYDKYLDF